MILFCKGPSNVPEAVTSYQWSPIEVPTDGATLDALTYEFDKATVSTALPHVE
jgi:hypothetical protein